MASGRVSGDNATGFGSFKEELEAVFSENEILKESLDNVMGMLAREDQGWFRFAGGSEYDLGMEVFELHRWARELRESVAGNPHIKQGLKLRTSYIWNRGIRYANIEGPKQGKGVNVQARIDNAKNQRNFFGTTAREKREAALYTDSAYFVLADQRDYTLQPVPIWEIHGHYSNPDDHGEVWAYLRCWSHYVPGEGLVPSRMWYLTDACPNYEPGNKKRPVDVNILGVSDPVDPNIIMFADHVNGQIGWPYGIPDALPALVWARLYRDFLVNGKIMSDALAQIAYKAVVNTQAGATNASLKLAKPNAPGSTVITGSADSLVPMATAGKGYDFGSGNSLAAVIAAALEVSVVHLTADTSKAGSYGATATLDLPTQLAMRSRQNWHIAFDTRVLKWLGAKDPIVTFMSLDGAADIFRKIQAILLMWGSGLYAAEPIEKRLSELLDIVGNIVPKGVLIPNNSDAAFLLSPDRTAVPKDTGANVGSGHQDQGNPNATAPGQGQGTGVGNGLKGNDLRSDKIAQAAAALGQLVQEIEAEYGQPLNI